MLHALQITLERLDVLESAGYGLNKILLVGNQNRAHLKYELDGACPNPNSLLDKT
jgi:hypothetical protein